ncbi:MAG: type II toxin-antitoxin system HipA family toxin [Methylococcales bacterium]
MSDSNKQRYDLYLDTPFTGLIKAAEAVLLESAGQLSQMGFRYTDEYLNHPHAFALDPIQLPLQSNEINLTCAGGMPGILDDYLPDDWGRKVLTKLAFYRDQRQLNSHSAIDVLAYLSNSRIGAIKWVMPGEKPEYAQGCDIKLLASAETAAQSVDDPQAMPENIDEMSLLYLANAGSGVGGARPKALLYENDNAYLAKFNRLTRDDYNNAKVELACLRMAQAAGLNVFLGHIQAGVNKRDVLLLNRFDIVLDEQQRRTRQHLITINALLKNTQTQRDRGGVFRYDDIAEIVRMYSINIETDLKQLLRLMLFNRCINNTDDHERNFSLMNNGEGYCLAPAYDLVPSLVTGMYPVAGYQYSHRPPTPREVTNQGKVFGLPKTQVKRISEEVIEAVEKWEAFAQNEGVSEQDSESIRKVMTT